MAKSIEFGVRKIAGNGFDRRGVEVNKGSKPSGKNLSPTNGPVTVINGWWNKNSKKA